MNKDDKDDAASNVHNQVKQPVQDVLVDVTDENNQAEKQDTVSSICNEVKQPMTPSKASRNLNQLEAMFATAKTRSDMSALCTILPPIKPSRYPNHRLPKVKKLMDITNAFMISQLPSESVIKKAEDLFNKRKKTSNRSTVGVVIPEVGQFDDDGIAILAKFCQIAELSRKVLKNVSGCHNLQVPTVTVTFRE